MLALPKEIHGALLLFAGIWGKMLLRIPGADTALTCSVQNKWYGAGMESTMEYHISLMFLEFTSRKRKELPMSDTLITGLIKRLPQLKVIRTRLAVVRVMVSTGKYD